MIPDWLVLAIVVLLLVYSNPRPSGEIDAGPSKPAAPSAHTHPRGRGGSDKQGATE